jgi:xanthine/uracil permease
MIKLISYPILLLFLAVNAYCVYKAGTDVVQYYKAYFWFAGGIVAYFVTIPLFRKNLKFIETFTHELTHTIVGLIFFQRIHSFTATNGEGGLMEHSGNNTNNVFITLAPYCLPIFTFALLLLRIMIKPEYLRLFDVLIGLSVAFHFVAIIKDIRPNQTDIKNCGYIFSYLFILAFLLFNGSVILWSIQSGIGEAFVNWCDNTIEVIAYFIS